MASVNPGNGPVDLSVVDFSDYANATLSSERAKAFNVQYSNGMVWNVAGKNFTYDANGHPTGGTITQIVIHLGGSANYYFSVTGASLSAAAFDAFAQANDLLGFEKALLSGNDTLFGTAGYTDHLEGFDGNDVLQTGGGAGGVPDYADGGNGDDTIVAAGLIAADSLNGGAGTDTLFVDTGVFNFTSFKVRDMGFEKFGGIVSGTSGADNYDFSGFGIGTSPNGGMGVFVNGMAGDDAIKGMDGIANHLNGSDDNDTLTGGNRDDVLSGDGGADTLDGRQGDDQLTGGDGDDIIHGGGGDDIVNQSGGGGGNGVGNDTIYGDDGDDTLYGGTGNSTLDGGSGNDTLVSGSGADHMIGGNGNDTISLTSDGDVADGGTGNDLFYAGNFVPFGGGQKIDGGAGRDTVILYADGDLSLTSASMANVENLEVFATTAVHLTVDNTVIAAGSKLTVDASFIPYDSSGNSGFTFNGTAETDGSIDVIATPNSDVISGGDRNDQLDAGADGSDTLNGGSGNDIFYLENRLDSTDRIDGGNGNDLVVLGGVYSGPLADDTLQSVERIAFIAPLNGEPAEYSLTLADGNVAAGATLTIDTRAIASDAAVDIDGSLETNGKLIFKGGAAADAFVGGSHANTFQGAGGADHLTGGAGVDQFIYAVVSDSTSTTFDTISNFNGAHDRLAMGVTVSAVDTAITQGALSDSSFDTDMAAAVNSGTLAAHNAVLFTPNSGDYSGQTFLIVDANGAAGYQAGQDFVIALDDPTNLNKLAHAF